MKTINKILILIWILIIFLIGIVIYSKQFNTRSPEVCINKTCFSIEIAETDQQRQLGLMFRKELEEKSGMLFVFQHSYPYGFWMKNTLIPLDMIRINDKNEIIDIQQATPCTQDPCPSYVPKSPALYVLELNSWSSEKYWIHIGDKIKIKK